MRREEFKGKEVTIMTCSNCNAKCKHCYISYEGNFEQDTLYNLCAELTKKYRVLLNGTEILLHPEYFDSLKLVGQNFLLTNGIELVRNPDIIEHIAKIGVKFVGTSYHYGIHTEISTVSQQIVEENIARLRKYGIGTDLRVTITNRNYMLIPQMCEKAVSLGATGIKFTNYMQMGAALNLTQNNVLTERQIEEFFELLEQVRRRYSREDLLIRRCGSFGKNTNNCDSKFCCTAGMESVVITPDLNVYPCFFLAKKGMEIGHVEEGKIIIDYPIVHCGSKCLAKEVNNNGYQLKK